MGAKKRATQENKKTKPAPHKKTKPKKWVQKKKHPKNKCHTRGSACSPTRTTAGKRSAYANADMPARARKHAHRAHRARFGSSRGESPTRHNAAEREERRKAQEAPKKEKPAGWFGLGWLWGSHDTPPGNRKRGRAADRAAPARRRATSRAWRGNRGCEEPAVYAFAPCDHALLCVGHFREYAKLLALHMLDPNADLADILPKCAVRKECTNGDISSAECCTVRRNPLVAKTLDGNGRPTFVMTVRRSLNPHLQRDRKTVACGPCVNDRDDARRRRVCDRPNRAISEGSCIPPTSEELGRFYKAVQDTWKYGAWITPQERAWGTGTFGPGT